MKLNLQIIEEIFKDYSSPGECGFRHFSVLVPVVEPAEEDGEPELLYEVRASRLERQPGEICFPGGLIEDGETPERCALRETEEEIGVSPESVRILAGLGSVFSTSGSQIHAFLGVVSREAYERIRINRDEVAEVFTVGVEALAEAPFEMYENRLRQEPDPRFPYEEVTGGSHTYNWRNGVSPVPVYKVDGRIIWGLTGRITMEFLEEVKKCSK